VLSNRLGSPELAICPPPPPPPPPPPTSCDDVVPPFAAPEPFALDPPFNLLPSPLLLFSFLSPPLVLEEGAEFDEDVVVVAVAVEAALALLLLCDDCLPPPFDVVRLSFFDGIVEVVDVEPLLLLIADDTVEPNPLLPATGAFATFIDEDGDCLLLRVALDDVPVVVVVDEEGVVVDEEGVVVDEEGRALPPSPLLPLPACSVLEEALEDVLESPESTPSDLFETAVVAAAEDDDDDDDVFESIAPLTVVLVDLGRTRIIGEV
jgi:hypothetical protein